MAPAVLVAGLIGRPQLTPAPTTAPEGRHPVHAIGVLGSGRYTQEYPRRTVAVRCRPEAGVRRVDARERDPDRLRDGEAGALEARVVGGAGPPPRRAP
jgi:hypothetical protein